ncbi:MAG TPA: hypothetical protein DGG95_13975 [Cytophagales bacterium]|jgi:hypothetical protein|nr:hypothetical protein [Cytophagales bacterium]
MMKYFWFAFSLLTPLISYAQRCGTVEYEKIRQQRHPSKETIDQFELWLQNKMGQRAKSGQGNRTQSANYVVPVVVHVIHSGEAIGTGTNISDAQILSQIKVLNDDFERLNADTTKTLTEFKTVAGKFPITFVMAQQDPNGLATTGIVRVKGTQTSWSIADNYTLKALSYWPAENYFNIWVTNLSGGLLGYTQLPVSSTLLGLEDSSNDRLTDGVVIDYQTYGTADAAGGSNFNLISEYNKGRTATHEVGHFFGLRHVWGDCSPFSCGCTDYVSDTPFQDTDYNGQCPSSIISDCSGHSMYANYMNYTDDACMNIFSQGQVDRMDVIINNSPRRVSLLTSIGSQPPSPVPNDIGIKSIASPGLSACDGSVTPAIVIHNFGTNDVTSTQINLSLNGNVVETKTFSLSLSTNAETTVAFSSVALAAGTNYNFLFNVLQTNGVADGSPAFNTISETTSTPLHGTLPIAENFNSMPAQWSTNNPDGLTTWVNTSIGGSHGGAMFLDYYNYDNQGTSDFLITPVLDLTNSTIASLSFDYAYAKLSTGSKDGLRVLVTTACDFNSSSTEIFNKAGSTLATVTSDSPFIPTDSQWASSGIIPLNQFLGQRIQIAFVGFNDFGNNLYIDNVSVLDNPITGFKLNGILTPSPVSCEANYTPVIQITNVGNTVINSFTVDAYLNNQLVTKQFTGVTLNPSQTASNFSLNATKFNSGANSFAVVIKSPNGNMSGAFVKDSINTKRYISTASDFIPLAQNFDNGVGEWITMNPTFGPIWYPTATNKGKSLEFEAINDASIGDQAWVVSPVLDLSKTSKASLTFESSYAYNFSSSETLRVLVSTDCGENFNQILYTSSGSSLANANATSAWLPSTKNEWRKNFINLDNFVGQPNTRFAFVATNANGNNLYLDNIQFFVNDNVTKDTLTIENLYSVYGGITGSPVQVTFNLPARQNVHIQVYGITGNVILDNTFTDTLNQTYTLLEPNTIAPGLFIVRVQTQSPSTIRSTKVLSGFN